MDKEEIVTAWIICLGAALLFLAVYRGISGEKLFSDWILVTLLGTSTATIIGLPLVIIKGLFLNDKKNENRSSPTDSIYLNHPLTFGWQFLRQFLVAKSLSKHTLDYV